MGLIREPLPVRGFVVREQAKRLGPVPLLQPVERHVRNHIRDVAGHEALRAAVRSAEDEVGVEVIAMVGQHGPIVETGWTMRRPLSEMPLPEECRLIACLLEKLRER